MIYALVERTKGLVAASSIGPYTGEESAARKITWVTFSIMQQASNGGG